MKLNISNFFNRFAIDSYSEELDSSDRPKALILSLVLGILTAGIVQIVVASIKCRKWEHEDSNNFPSIPNPHMNLLKLTSAEQARFFADPANFVTVKSLKEDAKSIYLQLRESYVNEKKKLPAEEMTINLIQEFNAWLQERTLSKAEIVLDENHYCPPYVFEMDVRRTGAKSWMVNGNVVEGAFKTLLNPLVKSLYLAFDRNLILLDNFSKIAFQGFQNIAAQAFIDRYRDSFFVACMNETQDHWNLETTDSQLKLEYVYGVELGDSDWRDSLGAATSKLTMRIAKTDLARGDLSNMQLILYVSALQ